MTDDEVIDEIDRLYDPHSRALNRMTRRGIPGACWESPVCLRFTTRTVMEIEVRMCMKALAEDVGRCIRMDVRTINATFKGDDLWAWCIQYYDKYTVKE